MTIKSTAKVFWFLTACLLATTSSVTGVVTQFRWCYEKTASQAGTWIRYDDSEAACVECGPVTKFYEKRKSSDVDKCCYGDKLLKSCSECNTLIRDCINGNKFCADNECNGYNDCGDGYDELKSDGYNCISSLCDPGQYICKGYTQCLGQSHVCDGVKDCVSGSDEINCLYYGGRCSGFTCTKYPQCVESNAVCNGVKDCVDGTDEVSCNRTCRHLFQCDNSSSSSGCNNTIETSLICDGQDDCQNGIDEQNCFVWSSWSAWSPCDCSFSASLNGTRYRTRNCGTFRNINSNNEGKCIGTNKKEDEKCICELTTQPAATTYQMTTVADSPLNPIILSIIVLASVIGTIVIATALYFCWMQSIKTQRKRHSSTKTEQIYNPHHSLGGDSVFSASSGFATRPAIQFSPATPLSVRHSFHGSSLMLNGSAMQQSNFYPGSLKKRPNFPPPLRPDEEEIYEKIPDPVIDPYAETSSNIGLPRSKSLMSLSTETSIIMTPHRQRSASITSVEFQNDEGFVRTNSNLSKKSYRNRTISRVPLAELGPAPTPTRSLKSSTDSIDIEGYMLPVSRPGSTYTTMHTASPERIRKFKTALSSPALLSNNRRHKQGLTKNQRTTMQSQRYKRHQNPRERRGTNSKSLYIHRSKNFDRKTEDTAYHSDSYATMKARVGDGKRKYFGKSVKAGSPPPRNPGELQVNSINKGDNLMLQDTTSLKEHTRRHSSHLIHDQTTLLSPPPHAPPKLNLKFYKKQDSTHSFSNPIESEDEEQAEENFFSQRPNVQKSPNIKQLEKNCNTKEIVYATLMRSESSASRIEVSEPTNAFDADESKGNEISMAHETKKDEQVTNNTSYTTSGLSSDKNISKNNANNHEKTEQKPDYAKVISNTKQLPSKAENININQNITENTRDKSSETLLEMADTSKSIQENTEINNLQSETLKNEERHYDILVRDDVKNKIDKGPSKCH